MAFPGPGGARLFLALAAWLLAGIASRAEEGSSADGARSQPRYERALRLYTDGRLREAQRAFAAIARDYPDHKAARTAVVRIQYELDQDEPLVFSPAPAARERGLAEGMDELLLGSLPAYLRFERTLGDARTRAGTLRACQGRVEQLLAERRWARSRKAPFRKERELRAMVRRMPAMVG